MVAYYREGSLEIPPAGPRSRKAAYYREGSLEMAMGGKALYTRGSRPIHSSILIVP